MKIAEIVEKLEVPMSPRWVRMYDLYTDLMTDVEASKIRLAIFECPKPPSYLPALKLAENLYLCASLECDETRTQH